MTALAFVVHVAALVVAVAGVRKVADPAAVARSLAAARLPSSPVLGRALGATEVGIGVWVLAGGGAWSAAALAALYAGFLAFIAANRLRGLDVPCGCLGESEVPPGPVHVVVDLVGMVAGAAAVVVPVEAATGWLDHGALGVVALVGVAAAGAATIVALEASSRSSRG